MQPTVTFKDSFSRFINKYFSYLMGKSVENPNLTKSLIFHFILLVLVSGMLPTCSRKIEKPTIISVDLLPGTIEKAQPKAEPKPADKPDEPKPPQKTPLKQDVQTKMEKAEDPKPVEKEDTKAPAPTKIDKKPEPPKKEKQKHENKKDEKDREGQKRLLKNLADQKKLDDIFDDAAKDEPKPKAQPQATGQSDQADPSLVNQIMGLVKNKVEQNWNIPIGVKDVQNMRVPLYIKLDRSGKVIDVKITDQMNYTTNDLYRVLADSAVRAVWEASPFQGLPADKFDQWQELELSFDPSQAL